APADDEQLRSMREELAQMRSMIEREMHRLTDERLRGSPVRLAAMELMEDYGFDAGITRDIVLELPADTPLHRGRGLMLGLISRRLPVCPVDPLETGGVIALVGPTGAGKTTTIAKLAARFVAEHGPRDIALVTTDTARIGGREQLHGYGRQLGIAVHEADSDAALIQLLQRLQDYRLVLVDTAGLGQRDRALASQLNWLRAARNVSTLLVLPANQHYSDLDEVVRRFGPARPQGVVLTKVDETGRLGSALSVVVDHQLPLTWITDGQHVPEDLHRANAASLVLRLEDLRRAADKPNIPEADHAVAGVPPRHPEPCLPPDEPRTARPRPQHRHHRRQGWRGQDQPLGQPGRLAGGAGQAHHAAGRRPWPGQRGRAAGPVPAEHPGRPGRRPLRAGRGDPGGSQRDAGGPGRVGPTAHGRAPAGPACGSCQRFQ